MPHHKGFILLKALVVVALIGVLAAVVVPAFKDTNKSVLASMRADLRALGKAQEEFFGHAQRYADAIAPTQTVSEVAFVPSPNNAVTLSSVTPTGWAAEVTNPTLRGRITRCGMFVGGGARPNTAVKAEGAPACY
jgi:Tfp pilus assembly protein PilE